ncbi:hypothetical protein EMCRGX_G031164 [Ephydatia muelleri]
MAELEFREMAVDSRHINDALDNAPGPEPSSSEEKGGGERTDDAVGSDEEKLSPKDVRCEVNELRLRSSTIDQLSRDETELRIKVYFHISNPLNRWRKYRYVTWKFFLQLVKTFCIAAQIALFVSSPAGLQSSFISETHTVFSKLLIASTSPGSTGIVRPSVTYDTYSTQDTLGKLELAANNFYTRPFLAIGYDRARLSNGSMVPIQVVAALYSNAELNTSDNTYVVNTTLVKSTFNLLPAEEAGSTITQQFLKSCGDRCFDRLLSMDVIFAAKHIRVIIPAQGLVQCFSINVKLSFVALDSGIGQYSLSTALKCSSCKNAAVLNPAQENLRVAVVFTVLLNVILGLISAPSFVITLFTLKIAYVLAKAMRKFYQNSLHIQLHWSDCAALYPYWHLFSIMSDLCTFTATAMKLALDVNFECQHNIPYDGDLVRIFLGIGVVLHATVILRYVSYFRQFNVLSKALDRAAPQLFKYILFVTILFLAFMLCGWVVLSPFHKKFATLTQSFNTLFTVLNGDDLYSTFTTFEISEINLVYIFGHAFLTIFMTLFIYTVLNLFISLIVEAHEESQGVDSAKRNEVTKFVYSEHLTEGGRSLKDLGLSKKPTPLKDRLQSSLTRSFVYVTGRFI